MMCLKSKVVVIEPIVTSRNLMKFSGQGQRLWHFQHDMKGFFSDGAC